MGENELQNDAKSHKVLREGKKLFAQIMFLFQNEDDFIQFSVYLIFSILGALYKHYFFSLHLFDLFSRLSLLKNVF